MEKRVAAHEAREEAVADVLPARHAARERITQETTAQHQVLRAIEDRLHELGNASGVVLVVGVEHDDSVGPGLESRVE